MEHTLGDIVDAIPGLVWTARPDGYVDFLNQRWSEYTGLRVEDAGGWRPAVHPDDLPGLLDRWHAILASGEPGEMEARLRRFDGEYRWYLFRVDPLVSGNGQVVKWCGINTDIEDRRRADEALRRSERQFRLLVETIPALVWRGTPEGELDYLNRRAVEYLGQAAADLTGGRWLELVHPDHRDETVRRWLDAAMTGSSYADVYQLKRADGRYRWIQSVGEPLRDTDGRISHWYGLIVDIEDRKRAEDDLRRSESFLADGQRLSATGTASWYFDTNDVTLSDELRRMFELATAEAVTLERLLAFIHPEDAARLAEQMEQIRTHHTPFEHDFRLRMPDGRVKHLRSFGHVVRHGDGRLEALTATQDVTPRRLAEEALDKVRSELARVTRAMSLGVLTASIAHEVNQPLSGIVTNASTCLRMLDTDPPNIDGARETARRAIRDGHRASDVVGRLRALFTRKAFTLEAMDLNEATREVIALSLSELQRSQVVLQSDLADDLPTMTGDRVQLQQVVLNLLRNASDAMAGVNDRPRQLLIRTQPEGDGRVRLIVRDAGGGIDGQNLERLFDAFFTTKSNGMGMGLSISRSIVERHHGRLWAEPNAGPGATFSFSIPCDPARLGRTPLPGE